MSASEGMVVVGLVAGCHLIEDIRVAVPYKVAVPLTLEQVLHSKDLQRGLQGKQLFQLSGHRFPNTGIQPINPRVKSLERENVQLRSKLREAEERNERLLGLLDGLQAQRDQMGSLQAVLERLPALLLKQPEVQLRETSPERDSVEESVVGGEIPMFLPGEIAPKGARVNVKVTDTTTKAPNVVSAASRLKKIRKEQGSS